MAKKSEGRKGVALVIVESPAKARTIGKFLGAGYQVESSIGHIRDLPEGKKQLPEKYKGEEWDYLGVNVNDNFEPVYVIPPGKKQQVKKLKDALKNASELYLATDEDREGEAISWHLHETLKPKVPVHRLVFHEITREAIENALAHPRTIDDGLVRAQETRRILDRLYGYDVSNLLWRKVRYGLSAGRVQSVAVRLIVQRERERVAFCPATYWDLIGHFETAKKERIQATLVSVDGKRIPSGKDFDPDTGKIKNPELLHLDEQGAADLAERLKKCEFKVLSLEEKPYTSRPNAPFTTSTMQQEANRKLGFASRRTMGVAQSLYENGHITYMRTDSTNLADVAIEAARDLVSDQYGEEYLPDKPRSYQAKVKNAQEAHEAIRPAGHPFELPEALRGKLTSDEFRLFELIWKRTIASQMADAKGRTIKLVVEGGGARFHVSGKVIDFAGYFRAYVEGSDDPEAELADKEILLPSVKANDPLHCQKLESKSHTTQPPARFTEASLIGELVNKGIGRPSTYSSIIDTILHREYVFKKGSALVPNWIAFAVCTLLETHFPSLVDYQFTAKMEDDLDAISRNEADHVSYLKQFYFGDGKSGLKHQLASKLDEIDPRIVNRFTLGKPEEGEEIFVRVGKYGPFLEQGERRASLVDNTPPDEINIASALELLNRAEIADEPLGTDPETQRLVYIKEGRFGTYIQLAAEDEDSKPKNASLLKDMKPEDVTLELALKLLSLPRTLGEDPTSKEPVLAMNGRYGPYVSCLKETRSLPAELSPIDVTLEQALALLAQPKQQRGRGAPKEPIKVFEASPVTEEPIKLLDGRFGPYVTDGTTNASLPRGDDPAELTFERAVDLLAIRAAKGPTKKKKKKKAAKKKTTKKKAKTAKKKAVKKKSVKKKPASSKES